MDFFGIGPLELFLILVVLLIVVGPAKLPEVAGAIGRGIRMFKEATSELGKDLKEMADDIKDTSKEIDDTVNSGTGLTGDLREVSKDIRSVRREVNTVLNPRGELVRGVKEIVEDIAGVGKEIGGAVRGEGSSSKDSHRIAANTQALTEEAIALEQTSEKRKDSAVEETGTEEATGT